MDHWIAFALLVLLGINMIREARCPDEEDTNASLAFRVMLPMAVATSIDALAVGITFAFLEVSILPAVCFIAATTFLLSCIGVKVGNLCGTRFQSKAELLGASSLSFWASKSCWSTWGCCEAGARFPGNPITPGDRADPRGDFSLPPAPPV